MNLEILTKEKAPLLSREEINAKVAFFGSATPSRAEIREIIAKEVKKDPELVAVKKITNKFGANEAYISALVYDSMDEMKKLEPQLVKQMEEGKKKADEEAKKAAEEAAAAKEAEKEAPAEEEKPAEEKKEETKEEKPAEDKKEEKPKEEDPKKEDKPAKDKEEKKE